MSFDEWFRSKQGLSYDSMFLFARDAWDAAQRIEREECAKLCQSKHANGNYAYDHRDECAEAILERK